MKCMPSDSSIREHHRAGPFFVATLFLLAGASPGLAQCPVGPLEMLNGEHLVIEGVCDINGDIKLGADSLLLVSNATLTIRGNLNLVANATLVVRDTTIFFDNQFNMHRVINGSGTSTFRLQDSVVHTTIADENNFFMGYFGRDDSTWIVENSTLDETKSWLLASLSQRAKLFLVAADHIPTEVFALDETSVGLGPGSDTDLWLPFRPGTSAVMHLPDQSTGVYSYSFGRNSPDTSGIGYQVDIIDAKVRLHLQSHPFSQLVVFGRNASLPSSGELTIGYHMYSPTPGPETISGLRPGYEPHRRFTNQGRLLELFNVKLTPVGWNVYVINNNAPVTIMDSIVNEVAAEAGGVVEIQNSVVQLSLLASNGGGSSMVLRNSQIYAQSIHTTGDGRLELLDSFVHGSVLEAKEDSVIRISGGLLGPNGDGEPCTPSNAVNEQGIPRCNPFLPPGALPVIIETGGGQVIIDPPGGNARADLRIFTTRTPETVAVGETFTHSALVANAGPDAATEVEMSFQTPPNALVRSFPTQCAMSGPDVLCSLGDLPRGGATPEVIITYEAGGPPGVVNGQVSVTGHETDPDLANNVLTQSTTVEAPPVLTDLQISGSAGPNPITVGNAFFYAAQAVNGGPDAATGVKITFPIPSGGTVKSFSSGCSVAGGEVVCNVGGIASGGGTGLLSVVYEAIGPVGPIAGVVSVSGNETDPSPGNNEVSLSIEAQPGTSPFTADLQIVGASGPEAVEVGESFIYSVQVGNAGGDDATGVTLLFQTPPGAAPITFSPGCSASAGDVVCNVGALAFGAGSSDVSVVYEANDPVGLVTGVVSTYGNERDAAVNNNSIAFTTRIGSIASPPDADLLVVGSSGPASVTVGASFMYAVQAGNAGTDDATGVAVLFQTPPRAVVESFSSGCALSGSDVVCDALDLPALGPGSPIFTVVYEAQGPAGPIAGVVSVGGNEHDPVPTNNRILFSTQVTPVPSPFRSDLRVFGASGPSAVTVGDGFLYAALAANAGPDPASGVQLIFRAPPNATVASSSAGCSAHGADVVCNVGALAAGGSSGEFRVIFEAPGPPGSITGSVSVSGNETDLELGNNELSFTTTVNP